MKFLIDANLPASLTEVFTEAGHDCVHMESLLLRYSPDTEIAPIANASGATLVTTVAAILAGEKIIVLR